MKKIICLATDGGSREDGSVYYSAFVLVESATLSFKEPVFRDTTSSKMTSGEWIAAVRSLGYVVEEPDNDVVIVDEISYP